LGIKAIVGIAVGAAGLILGVALILLIFFIKRRRKPKSKKQQKETKNHSHPSEEQGGETKDNLPMGSQQDSGYVALSQNSSMSFLHSFHYIFCSLLLILVLGSSYFHRTHLFISKMEQINKMSLSHKIKVKHSLRVSLCHFNLKFH
jgi:Ca2+/Na+ antiporter